MVKIRPDLAFSGRELIPVLWKPSELCLPCRRKKRNTHLRW
ncbi:MAG: hypothetical protein R2751_19375 [Bacteroidales bacterium]